MSRQEDLFGKTAGGPLLDQGYDIATDTTGNSYVVGAIQTNGIYPTVTFDAITLTGHGDYDWFIAKYDANGPVVWARTGGPAGDMAYGVALDNFGGVYVAGFFKRHDDGRWSYCYQCRSLRHLSGK